MALATIVLELDEEELDSLAVDGTEVPLFRLGGAPPYSIARFGEQEYRYTRSFPAIGYGAALPGFLRQYWGAGKKTLLIERKERLYVYVSR